MKTFTHGISRAALVAGAGVFALMAPGVVGFDIDFGQSPPAVQMADGASAQAAAPGGRGAHGQGGKHLGGRKGAGHKGKGSQHDPESGHSGGGGKSHVPESSESEHTGHSGGGGGGGGGGGDDHTDTEHVDSEHGEGHGGKGGKGEHGSGEETTHGGGRPDGGRGGAPVWAKGGIPEVELGRMNVGPVTGHVIQRALDEALENWDASMAALYQSTAEGAADTLATAYDSTPRIDSPLQNLGLYKDLLANRRTALPGVAPASVLDLAAIFLGSASDKSIPIGVDSVTALNTIFGLSLSADDTALLAAKADKVRAGILAGHGE